MRRGDVRSRVQGLLADTQSVFWSAAQVDALIDEAMEVVSESARIVHRTAYVAQRPGQFYYFTQSIDPLMMLPLRIWSHATDQRLEAIALSQLDQMAVQWERTTGSPQYWFSVSWDVFGVWPGAAEGGGVLRIDYQAWPRERLSDTDLLEMPEASIEAILFYCQYDGLLKHHDISQAAEFYRLFEEEVGVAAPRSGVNRRKDFARRMV